MTIAAKTLYHMNGKCGITAAHSDEDHHKKILRNIDRARAGVQLETPCTTCGKTMEDEFYDHLFDGVMNDYGDPFHHGCEDF